MNLILRLLFLFISIHCFQFESKATPVVINQNKDIPAISVEKFVYFFEDKHNTITIDSLLQKPNSYTFKKSNSRLLNFGFTESTVWLRIDIFNQTSLSKDFLFTIDYAILNDVTYYETTNNVVIREIKTGENEPFNAREIAKNNFVFHLNNFPLQYKTYYIKINSNGDPMQIPMQINNPIRDNEVQSVSIFGTAIYNGYLLFSILLNILLLFNFKERQYFYFGGFIFFYASFIFIMDGFAFQYIFPNSPWLSNHSLIIVTAITNFFMLAFARDFLLLQNSLKRTSNIFFAIFIMFFIASFLGYPFHKHVVRFANIITFITMTFIFIISIYYLKKNNSLYNQVFFISYFFVMFGTTTYILRNLNLIPDNYLTENAMKMGFFFQILVLTFAQIIKFKIDLTDINTKLEKEVKEQTTEIRTQNERLFEHNSRIEEQSKQITDSIVYAKRIQTAILPDYNTFKHYFKQHFIYFKPKQIVSGDFYWYAEKNNKIFIAVADCTGHGVPGGFLSMLGISFLNEIINKEQVISPNHILNELQQLILKTLSSNVDNNGSATPDGMDISLCSIDFNSKKIEFAGANNPLFIIRNNEIVEHKVDKFPIGHHSKNEKKFTNYELDLMDNDCIYLLSDGIIDQYSIEFQKCYSKPRFKKLLLEIHQMPFEKQQFQIENTIEKWQGTTDQFDDILVVGLLI